MEIRSVEFPIGDLDLALDALSLDFLTSIFQSILTSYSQSLVGIGAIFLELCFFWGFSTLDLLVPAPIV